MMMTTRRCFFISCLAKISKLLKMIVAQETVCTMIIHDNLGSLGDPKPSLAVHRQQPSSGASRQLVRMFYISVAGLVDPFRVSTCINCFIDVKLSTCATAWHGYYGRNAGDCLKSGDLIGNHMPEISVQLRTLLKGGELHEPNNNSSTNTTTSLSYKNGLAAAPSPLDIEARSPKAVELRPCMWHCIVALPPYDHDLVRCA